MSDHFKKTRDNTVAEFAEHAAKLFASDPARQSVLLAVSQYWNDSANDEVHGFVVASSRTTPVWPHECNYDYGDETNDFAESRRPVLADEQCWFCRDYELQMDFYGGYGDAMVGAFEQFCRESAHQSMSKAEAFVPFAIARRAGERVEIEQLGHVQRTPTVMTGSARIAREWPDARARALFEQVCLHADDDAPRAVLSDYLLEHHPDDPRGEAIALALARELDDDTRARRDALFADEADRWMFPLGDVIPAGCAQFERGFLARADVFAASDADRDRVLAAPAWGTVHTIRFAPESRDVIGPTMHALRDVGPVRDAGLRAIARARRPWAIERLRVGVGAEHVDELLRATTLPRLHTLEIDAVHREDLVPAIEKAPWRVQRLLFVEREYGSLADWRSLRAQLDVPELGIAIAPYWMDVASSWELGFCADDSVTVRGGNWHTEATILRLAELLGELPPPTRIRLVSTPTREMTATDVTWLREYTGRDVGLDK